jgi:hypothetical protein
VALAPEWIILFFLYQLLLYVGPPTLVIIAAKTYKKSRSLACALIAVAAAPMGYYAHCFVTERRAALARDTEVASWPRKPVTKDNLPKVFVTTAGWWVAKTLVGAGPFEKAYARDPFDGWVVYERTAAEGCPSSEEWKGYASRAERLVSTRCVLAEKTSEPQLTEPHLRLLHDQHAPSRYRDPKATVVSPTLELRWSTGDGGDLIAFWEIPYFAAVTFPPIWLGRKGFARGEYAPRRYEQRPDPRTFVLEALKM